MQPGVYFDNAARNYLDTLWRARSSAHLCFGFCRIAQFQFQPFYFESKFADPDADKTHAVTMDSPLARRMLSNRAGVKIQERKEVNQMKTTISLLANLFVASTLFWGLPLVEADEIVADGSRRICGLLSHEVCADERSDFVLGSA